MTPANILSSLSYRVARRFPLNRLNSALDPAATLVDLLAALPGSLPFALGRNNVFESLLPDRF